MINENNNINETNQTVAMNNVAEPIIEDTDEEVIEEGDIVIEEDFQINLDVADISADEVFTNTSNDTSNNDDNLTEQLGTEQSGNITF